MALRTKTVTKKRNSDPAPNVGSSNSTDSPKHTRNSLPATKATTAIEFALEDVLGTVKISFENFAYLPAEHVWPVDKDGDMFTVKYDADYPTPVMSCELICSSATDNIEMSRQLQKLASMFLHPNFIQEIAKESSQRGQFVLSADVGIKLLANRWQSEPVADGARND